MNDPKVRSFSVIIQRERSEVPSFSFSSELVQFQTMAHRSKRHKKTITPFRTLGNLTEMDPTKTDLDIDFGPDEFDEFQVKCANELTCLPNATHLEAGSSYDLSYLGPSEEEQAKNDKRYKFFFGQVASTNFLLTSISFDAPCVKMHLLEMPSTLAAIPTLERLGIECSSCAAPSDEAWLARLGVLLHRRQVQDQEVGVGIVGKLQGFPKLRVRQEHGLSCYQAHFHVDSFGNQDGPDNGRSRH